METVRSHLAQGHLALSFLINPVTRALLYAPALTVCVVTTVPFFFQSMGLLLLLLFHGLYFAVDVCRNIVSILFSFKHPIVWATFNEELVV